MYTDHCIDCKRTFSFIDVTVETEIGEVHWSCFRTRGRGSGG